MHRHQKPCATAFAASRHSPDADNATGYVVRGFTGKPRAKPVGTAEDRRGFAAARTARPKMGAAPRVRASRGEFRRRDRDQSRRFLMDLLPSRAGKARWSGGDRSANMNYLRAWRQIAQAWRQALPALGKTTVGYRPRASSASRPWNCR